MASIKALNYYNHHDYRTSWLAATSTTPSSTATTTAIWTHLGNYFQPTTTYYDWSLSTEENYGSNEEPISTSSYGKFQDIRKRRLDPNFHSSYNLSRQLLQDVIIESMLLSAGGDATTTFSSMSNSTPEPWIIFTAGPMGAGKSYTMEQMHRKGKFPLESFVTVDPDEIRRRLPEFDVYVGCNPETAGELTRKEAGMMAEILTFAALERGQHVLVDGSLKDSAWYEKYFQSLRKIFPRIKLGIIHVTAPTDAIFERVKQRAKETGRVVPQDVLLQSIQQVPKSVKILKEQVDFFLEIHNSLDHEDPVIVSEFLPNK